MLAILETKLNPDLTARAAHFINPSWNMLNNLDHAPYGRILILYDPNIHQLSLLDANRQVIHCHDWYIPTSSSIYISFVYADNSANAREHLFQNIPNWRQETHPWIISGDFNCCLDIGDRSGVNPLAINDITPLKQLLCDANLTEIKTSGSYFTWNNKKKVGIRTLSKIDYGLCNSAALRTWPELHNHKPVPLLSDHSPQIITMGTVFVRGKTSFKYFNNWFEEVDFLSVVENNWNIPTQGTHMFRLHKKLKSTKDVLRAWSSNKFGKGNKQSHLCKEKLAAIQERMLTEFDNPSIAAMETEATLDYQNSLIMENSMIKQKSRFRWMIEGDRNTAFFHATLKTKQTQQNIFRIKDKQGLTLKLTT